MIRTGERGAEPVRLKSSSPETNSRFIYSLEEGLPTQGKDHLRARRKTIGR